MNDNTYEIIALFFLELAETEEYKEVEYLAFSIRKGMLDYLSSTLLHNFEMPPFLSRLKDRIINKFSEYNISPTDLLNYMVEKDTHGWVWYYDTSFIRKPDQEAQSVQCDSNLLFLVVTGFLLDIFRENHIDINKIIANERFIYPTNQYKLTRVQDVSFYENSFVFDNKAYLYNILTCIQPIGFTDTMPDFARVIVDNVSDGDILLRVDERLAVPKEQMISYSSLNFEKFRGPQFHFKDSVFDKAKTIIVHIDPETCDKLLMVVKQDYDNEKEQAFMHVEIETLPYSPYKKGNRKDIPWRITTFLHGMYYPEQDRFTHIDYAKNQYDIEDYEKKYSDAVKDKSIYLHTEKRLHYKIWCIENGTYSKETWYKLMMVSLAEKYRVLLNEILD